jgi:hypothetical protein
MLLLIDSCRTLKINKILLKVLHRQLGYPGGLSYIYGVVNGYNNKNK